MAYAKRKPARTAPRGPVRKTNRTPQRKRYSMLERQAYWVGVGVSMAKHNEEGKLLDRKDKVGTSAVTGYIADNMLDVSKKFEKR